MGEEEVIAMDEFSKFEQKLAQKEAKKDTKLARFYLFICSRISRFMQNGTIYVFVMFLKFAMIVPCVFRDNYTILGAV